MATLEQLHSALIKADAAGNTADAIVIAREIKRMSAPKAKPTYSKGMGALQNFAQGITFGLSDELYGGISALTGGDYDSAVKSAREDLGRFNDAHPIIAGASNIAGGLTTGGLALKGAQATAKGAQALKSLMTASPAVKASVAAGTGAFSGGLSGFGAAEEGERLSGAGMGAAVGSALGASSVPIGYIAGKALDYGVMKPAGWAANRLLSTPEKRFSQELGKNLARDNITPEMLQKRLGKLGPNATIADAGGENVLGMAELYGQIPGASKNAAAQTLMQRAKGQSKRVTNSLMDSLSVDDVSFDSQIQKIHGQMREAGKAYAPIIDTVETPMNENIEKLLTGPTMKSALAKAFHIAKNDVALGDADATMQKYFALNDKGEGMFVPFTGMHGEIKQRPTLRVWDYAKRGLDSIINDGTDPITGKLTNEARQALLFKKKLLSEVDAIAPEYAEARKAFADEASLETSLKMGRAFFNKDAEVTLRHMADMSEPEKAMFRSGAARAARDKVLSAVDTADAYKRIFGNEISRQKLRAVFPDAKTFTKFARDIEREATFGRTKNAILGNSSTFKRGALQEDSPVTPEMIAGLMTSPSASIMGMIGRGAMKDATDIPESVRQQAAKYLYSMNPKIQQEAIGLLGKTYPRLIESTSPASLYPLNAALSGLLGQRLQQ